jgi:hypothetical protein
LQWDTDDIINDLKNGEVQKLFGTILHVLTTYNENKFKHLFISPPDKKKFKVYLRIITKMSNPIIKGATISTIDDVICLTAPGEKYLDLTAEQKKFKYRLKKGSK